VADLTLAGALAAGIALGLGLWTLLQAVPRFGRPRLAERLAPYLVDVSAEARELVRRPRSGPLPVLGVAVWPVTSVLRRGLNAALGGPALTRLRLRQAGSTLSVDAYRSRQLSAGALGMAGGILLAVALARTNGTPPVAGIALALFGGVAGVLVSDRLLGRRARVRVERMARELPAVLEFLSLSLSAGEGILAALRRVGVASSGELAGELRAVVGRVDAGVPLSEALRETSGAIAMPALTRLTEQLVTALERGSPLVDVLRAQAQDARDDAKRELLEVAGRKEVAMLVPLVFLILPVTVLFALWPGVMVLQLAL